MSATTCTGVDEVVLTEAHTGPDHDCGHAAPSVPLPGTAVLTGAGEMLRALSAPLRIAIVMQLRDGSRCVHELVDALDVSQPLVSQHLRVLKASKIVTAHRQGREMRYELIDQHLVDIIDAAVDHAGED